MESLNPGVEADLPCPALIPYPASLERVDAPPLVVGDRVLLVASKAVDPGVVSLVDDLLSGVGIAVDPSPGGDDAGSAAALGGEPLIELELRSPDGHDDRPRATSHDIGSVADAHPGRRRGDESYSIDVSSAGARLVADSRVGLYYAAQTLAQLLANRSGGAARVPALVITDAPRFTYRGAMLDVARHFFDVQTVERYIDRIALAKLNHLHLHLSDDQGWRLHIESWPRLTERGATTAVGGGRGGFYSADDYRRLVAYAADRGVTIVPEIDLPGHTHAAIVAYPQLAPSDYAGPPDASHSPDSPYTGIEVGFSTVDVTSDEVYRFVADVTREIAALTPGEYLHLGGDESLRTTDTEYLTFLRRASEVAAESGKTLVFWHEAGRSGDLPPGSIGQYWSFTTPRDGADALLRRFVERGGRVILSPADAVYLDMKQWADDPLGLTWADGPTTVQDAYSWEPGDVAEGVAEADILGIEAPLWSETVASLADIDHLAFPRILAAAEIAWSPAPCASPERSWSSFRERLAGWQPRLDALGVDYTRTSEVDWS